MGEKEFTTPVEDPSKPHAPKEEHGVFQQVKDKFSAHAANPGPAVPKDLPADEGSKEERQAKAKALNEGK